MTETYAYSISDGIKTQFAHQPQYFDCSRQNVFLRDYKTKRETQFDVDAFRQQRSDILKVKRFLKDAFRAIANEKLDALAWHDKSTRALFSKVCCDRCCGIVLMPIDVGRGASASECMFSCCDCGSNYSYKDLICGIAYDDVIESAETSIDCDVADEVSLTQFGECTNCREMTYDPMHDVCHLCGHREM